MTYNTVTGTQVIEETSDLLTERANKVADLSIEISNLPARIATHHGEDAFDLALEELRDSIDNLEFELERAVKDLDKLRQYVTDLRRR